MPFIRHRSRELVNLLAGNLFRLFVKQYLKPDIKTRTLLQRTGKLQESRDVRGDKTGRLLPDLASINTLKSERAPLLLVLFDVSVLRLGPA